MKKNNTIDYQQAIDALHSVLDWVRWSSSRMRQANVFLGHGTDNAWDEAVALVFQTLHIPFGSDPSVFQARITLTEKHQLVNVLQQRIEQFMPLAYITQRAWLMGLEFYVNQHVLIPRSPFAEWIARRFEPWVNPENITRILEIGTGSGCLAILAAQAFPTASIDAVDISLEALQIAAKNIASHQVEEQVKLFYSDCFENTIGEYDIIFSNPPYVSAEEMTYLPTEYGYEPKSSLQAEDEGLAVVLAILTRARHHLSDEGILVVEVGNSQCTLMQRLPDVPFVWLEQTNGGHGLFVLTKEQLESI